MRKITGKEHADLILKVTTEFVKDINNNTPDFTEELVLSAIPFVFFLNNAIKTMNKVITEGNADKVDFDPDAIILAVRDLQNYIDDFFGKYLDIPFSDFHAKA
jgi:hypothetical protein